MTAHSDLLDRYKRIREVRFRLNNLLVGTIPKKRWRTTVQVGALP